MFQGPLSTSLSLPYFNQIILQFYSLFQPTNLYKNMHPHNFSLPNNSYQLLLCILPSHSIILPFILIKFPIQHKQFHLQANKLKITNEMIKIQQKQYFRSIQEFHIFDDKLVGNGSFGVVKLGMHIRTCKIYAIKIVNLKNFASNEEFEVMDREINLHVSIDHPHIIKLWATVMENQTLYMIMQFAEKGNLFYHQNTKTVFQQKQAYRFFIQTAQAVSYLHSKSIIHRDIKPENLLLDSDYNIKLCDFGWCTSKSAGRRNTFCGTYQFMAPEMLFGKQYDQKIDIWALGVLLFELLHGHAPFKGNNAKEVKEKMSMGAYCINNMLSEECKEILIAILKFKPEDRIAVDDIFTHPWVLKMEAAIGLHYGFKPIFRNKSNLGKNKDSQKLIRISQGRSIFREQKLQKDVEVGTKSTVKTLHKKTISTVLDRKILKNAENTSYCRINSREESPISSNLNSEKYLRHRQNFLSDKRNKTPLHNQSTNTNKGPSQTKRQKTGTKNRKKTKDFQKAPLQQLKKKSSNTKSKSKSKSNKKSQQKHQNSSKQKKTSRYSHNYFLSPQSHYQSGK